MACGPWSINRSITILDRGSSPHTPIDGQAIGAYEVKEETATFRKPRLLCPVTKFAAHPSQRVVIHLHASSFVKRSLSHVRNRRCQ
jgi:hypothetical protein